MTIPSQNEMLRINLLNPAKIILKMMNKIIKIALPYFKTSYVLYSKYNRGMGRGTDIIPVK